MCSASGRVTPATVADHVIPHRGEERLFWSGELQSLCATCHSHYKQLHEAGKHSAACGVDGMPTDPQHPWNARDAQG